MNRSIKITAVMMATVLFSGCVAGPQLQVQRGIGTSVQRPVVIAPQASVVVDPEYGAKPQNYATSIRNYFSAKLARADKAQYKFSEPKRAYKRKGFAYGGDVAWKGWLVETSIAIPNRSGRLLTPKPYMVLFSGNQIVEDILGNSHKLVVKVDK
jgi:hypothetical protein